LQDRYPRALVIQRVLGEAYLAQRKPREALAALERALAGDPEDSRACCARALIHQMHGDAAAALAWYRRACEIRPEDYTLRDAYRELARQLKQPAYRPSSVGLARLFLRGDLFTHAIHEWETILAQQPDRLDAQVSLAEAYWRAGDAGRAGEIARHIVNNTRTCVKAMLIVAALEHAGGNDEAVERHFARALELDPERRIGRALYADLFARGDVGLETLFLGEPTSASATASTANATAAGGPASRHGTGNLPSLPVTETPTLQMPAVRQTASPTTGSQPAPVVTGPFVPSAPATAPVAAAQGQSGQATTAAPLRSNVSGNLRSIFAETEFMLWSRDEDDVVAPPAGALPTQSPILPPDPFEGSRVERFERSTVIVPPALAQSGGSMEDTEARAAIGWVRWLQALGARPIESAGEDGGSAEGVAASASSQTEALREMFAELDPAGRGPRVVEGELARPGAPRDSGASQDVAAGIQAVSEQGFVFGQSESETPSEARTDSARPGATVEDLERRFASSTLDGYAPDAAEATPDDAQAPALEVPVEPAAPRITSSPVLSSDDADGRGDFAALASSAAPAVTTPSSTAAAAEADESPAPDDYMGRLRLARRRRAAGRMEDSLLEYRALLRDSTDSLDDLIHDLRDMSGETDNSEVHRLLGDAYIREGNYLNALEAYNRALALSQSANS
jgi:tetratricopeptide (TPR) repeat protein